MDTTIYRFRQRHKYYARMISQIDRREGLCHPLWLVDLLGELRLKGPLLVDLVLVAEGEVMVVAELGNLVDGLAVACRQTCLQGNSGWRRRRKMET